MLLFAAACASDSSSSEPSVVVAEPAPASESPLEVRVGFSSDAGRRNVALTRLQRDADQALVACMARAGFVYHVGPVDPALLLGGRAGDGTREWAAVNGLGVTVALIEVTAANDRAGDAEAANAAYTAELDAAQAAAYDQALVGDTQPTGADGTFRPGGCWAESYDELFVTLGLLSELEGDLDRLNRRIETDPRVTAFMATWSECMVERGHRYTDRGAMVDDLYARLLSIQMIESDAGPSFSSPEAVDDLLASEISIALDDHDCSLSFAPDLVELRASYEREFLADNGSRIDAIIAASR